MNKYHQNFDPAASKHSCSEQISSQHSPDNLSWLNLKNNEGHSQDEFQQNASKLIPRIDKKLPKVNSLNQILILRK